MKMLKKLTGAVLVLLLVFTLVIGVCATERDPYQIYQIFTADYADGKLSNVKWGQNGTGTQGNPVSDEILNELAAVGSGTSDTKKLEVIKKYVRLDSTPVKTGTGTTYTDLPNGYYLVRNTPDTQGGENEFYTLYVVQVVNGTLTFVPKGDVPKSEKKIIEGSERTEVSEASIGDTISYQITGTLPSNIEDYNTYYYEFTDTLSKGLTYQPGSLKVEIGGEDVTQYFYIHATEYNQKTGTTITVAIADIKALGNLKNVTVDKASQVIVTYQAILNENAVVAGEGNPNDVVLKYSNDPNNSGSGTANPPSGSPEKPTPSHPTGETPKDEVKTFTTELTITKTDGEKILPGAEFTLTGEGVKVVLVSSETFQESSDGTYWKLKDGTYTMTAPVTAEDETNTADQYESTTTKYVKEIVLVAKGTGKTETTVVGCVDSETGKLTFTGLGAGSYIITETKTPAGYNTIAPIEFTLTFDRDTEKFVSNNNDIKVGEDNTLTTTIVNKAGTVLPGTGGMGTTLFYVIGGALVLAAVVLLVTRRRMRMETE